MKTEIAKNYYHETFLADIWFTLKKNHVIIYYFDYNTKLKYYLYRPVSKHNLFKRHLNYNKHFFVQFKNEWKKHKI